jgi:uncharacterized membrane protein YgdD (TMEM256/DUF423 family)
MRPWVLIAAVNGAMAVGFGAYAAHGLAADPHAAQLAERASTYQLIHALALLAADRLAAEGRRPAHLAAGLFTAGLALFCLSLYAKALMGAIAWPLMTPAGGIAFLAGWLALGVAALAKNP